ncbi:MAG TPA: HypC/HybG/HupF family hydrogenase formation chaperone [Thermomicrobiales bacterium]|nr:HypC/HybG/HupF family hydrogenase formation chaperone [Thermomicrobiales bacterium]
MCLPLIARVVAVAGDRAEVRLLEGQTARVALALAPDAAVGQYVLLDRGAIIEVVAPEQVEALLAFYAELADLWEGEDARSA